MLEDTKLRIAVAHSRVLASAVLGSSIVCVAALAQASTSHAAGDSGYEAHPVVLDSQEVRTGKWVYQISQGGQVVGTSTIIISLRDGLLHIRASSRLGADGSEEALILLDSGTLAPRTALLSATHEGALFHSSYEISDGWLRGTTYQVRADGEYASFDLDRKLPVGSFLRGSALVLLPAMPLAEGARFPFYWFESSQALLSRAEAEVTGVQSVRVPAGEFQAYEVRLRDGSTNMTVYVSVGRPRQVLLSKETATGYLLELVSFVP